MKCIRRILGAVLILLVAGIVVMYSGVINVAATERHAPLTAFVLDTTMDHSVRYHAKGITPPPLDDARTVMDGFRHYREMCVDCHLAPGIDSSEIRKGLLPEPPELQRTVADWKPTELFWIVRNGVKMTGMPAWGVTHSDAQIWAIVAFLEKLPNMTAAQYHEMDQTADADTAEPREHHDGEPIDNGGN